MSKLIEHAAYLEQDPNDIDSVFIVLKVGAKKSAIEAGAIEIAAKNKGWREMIEVLPDPLQEEQQIVNIPNPISAPESLRLWLVLESLKSIEAGLKQEFMAQAIETANSQLQTTLQGIL
jgi:hypothetical protein